MSLSGYLSHKDFADCCFSKSPLSIYFFHNLQGLAKWKVVSNKLAGTTGWEFEHEQILGSSWQQWLTEMVWTGGKETRVQLLPCRLQWWPTDPFCSVLDTFSWVTWDLSFQTRAVENLGGKSHRDEMTLGKFFPRGSLVFRVATMGTLCQPWCNSSCPRLIIIQPLLSWNHSCFVQQSLEWYLTWSWPKKKV